MEPHSYDFALKEHMDKIFIIIWPIKDDWKKLILNWWVLLVVIVVYERQKDNFTYL